MKGTLHVLSEVDELLRGRRTDAESLDEGAGRLDMPALLKASLLLAFFYGASIGLFGALNHSPLQFLAAMVKVPLLFLLSVAVSFPSLYVFAALTGARQRPAPMLRVLASSVAVGLAVLASLGPVYAFFTLTTTSYPFMKLLNLLFFAFSGAVALEFLRRTLLRLEGDWNTLAVPPAPRAGAEPLLGRARVGLVFSAWLLLYAFVTAQSGWVLRPFVGDPGQPFAWLNPRGGNPLADLTGALGQLFGG